MLIAYKNKLLERALIGFNTLASIVVVATFVALFGFDKPLLSAGLLYTVQLCLLLGFVAEKAMRRFNAVSKVEFWRINWLEVPLLAALGIGVLGAGIWFGRAEPTAVRHFAVGVYLVVQVVTKLCRTSVSMAASGRNPTRTLILSFIVLILSGAGVLMLPRATTGKSLSFVDALFTATSATCVTGLVVKDIGQDFSLMGQVVILALIQLGGLGIVIFGAVLALLLGQAFSLRESVAMQDLLSESTLGRIGKMIAFVFAATVLIEAAGALCLLSMWDNVPGRVMGGGQRWFCSIFHSISAFCNAGLGLFSDSLISYNRCWAVYVVICPLIVLGGLGFGVLYDLGSLTADKVKRLFKKWGNRPFLFAAETPRKMQLQSKIVLTVTASLIVLGTLSLVLFERYAVTPPSSVESQTGTASKFGVLDALFQSVTARTAGFSTVDIAALSASSKVILIFLMFIGGSPGGTAGGIKTVTLAVVIMAVVTVVRRRSEVEMFKRSLAAAVVGKAITVTVLFFVVLFTASLALSITENANGFTMLALIFEASSALGTVGLSTGITPSLTTAGKLTIIAVMIFGRLGPLTLLAALTFNPRPAEYNYPQEAVIVG